MNYLLPKAELFKKPRSEIVDHIYSNKYYKFCNKSITYLEEAINQDNNTKAMYLLSKHYINQYINKEITLRYCDMAITNGDIKIFGLLGKLYSRLDDTVNQLHYYKMASDKGSIKAMYKLLKYYSADDNIDMMLSYYDMIHNSVENTSNYKYKCKASEKLALYYEETQDPIKMLLYYQKIVDSYKGENDDYYSYQAIKTIGDYYSYNNNFPKMIQYYQMLFDNEDYHYHLTVDKKESFKCLMKMLVTSEYNKDFSIKYLDIGIKLLFKRKLMVMLATLYKNEGDIENMKTYYLMAITTKNCTESMYKLGLYYDQIKEYNNAITYYMKCIQAGNHVCVNNLNRLLAPFKDKADICIKFLDLIFIISCLIRNIPDAFKYYKMILIKIDNPEKLINYTKYMCNKIGFYNITALFILLKNEKKSDCIDSAISIVTESLINFYGENIMEYLNKTYPVGECMVCYDEKTPLKIPMIINKNPLTICPHQLCLECYIRVDKCPGRCGIRNN